MRWRLKRRICTKLRYIGRLLRTSRRSMSSSKARTSIVSRSQWNNIMKGFLDMVEPPRGGVYQKIGCPADEVQTHDQEFFSLGQNCDQTRRQSRLWMAEALRWLGDKRGQTYDSTVGYDDCQLWRLSCWSRRWWWRATSQEMAHSHDMRQNGQDLFKTQMSAWPRLQALHHWGLQDKPNWVLPKGYVWIHHVQYSLYPDIISNHCPAMLVVVPSNHQEHRERESEEEPTPTPKIFQSVDSFACPADMSDGETPADDEDDRVRKSRDERLKREAQSLEHMILHDRKNPFCEHCCRGRMLRRYAHRFRPDPEAGDMPYERAKEFGSIIKADNIFPSVESRGMALLVRDRYSGVSIAYPQTSRDEDSNYESLKHFAGHPLSGRTDTVFCSDTAQELTNAASRLCWVLDPSAPNYWPHNAHLERDVRTLKELSRPSHIQAGFHKRLWTLTIDYVSKARSFFSHAPIAMRRALKQRRTKRKRPDGMLQQETNLKDLGILLGHLCTTVQKEILGSQLQSQNFLQNGTWHQDSGSVGIFSLWTISLSGQEHISIGFLRPYTNLKHFYHQLSMLNFLLCVQRAQHCLTWQMLRWCWNEMNITSLWLKVFCHMTFA